MLSKLANFLIVLIGLLLVATMQTSELKQLKNKDKLSPQLSSQLAETSQKGNFKLLQYLPAFGFDNIVADLTFLNFLEYFGDDIARAQQGYTLSPEYFEIILNRDPYFSDYYVFLTASTTLYAGMPERTVALIDIGLESLAPNEPPDSFFAWRYKGVDELLFLGDYSAAEASFSMAANWADQSSDPDSEGIAQTSRQTAQFLAQNPKSQQARINAWFSVFTNAFDDRTRSLAKQRIESLGGSIEVNSDGTFQVIYPSES